VGWAFTRTDECRAEAARYAAATEPDPDSAAIREDGSRGDGPTARPPLCDTESTPGSTDVAKAERTRETRERILAAACEVIAEVGFEKIRMRMVAEHAGVSTALLHYHFENREKLFAEAMTYSFAQTGVELERDADSVPASLVLARILNSLLPTDPELRQDWRLWQELWVRALRDGTAQHLAIDLYDQLHTWSARRSSVASTPGNSPTATSTPRARCCSPCATGSASV
jgi:AcrR family transcriptional regulator